MKNKKKIIVISIVILVIVSLIILQIYNINNKTKSKGKAEKEDIVENVEVNYKEGKTLNSKDKYIEFEVIGNNSSKDVIYDINIKSKDNINTQNVKFTLEKKINDTYYDKVVDNKSYNDINNYYRMYIDIMPKNSKKVHAYKLSVSSDKEFDIEIKVNGNITTNYKPIG